MSLTIVRGKKRLEINRQELLEVIETFECVAVDIGTGDGKFVLRKARTTPTVFFIGLDPVAENMQAASMTAQKRASRGSASNTLFIVADVARLPDELEGVASKIYINLPWGSLLEGLLNGDKSLLRNITRMARRDAELEVLINYAVFYGDRVPVGMTHLPPLTCEYIDEQLACKYKEMGWDITERGLIGKNELKNIPTTWAKKLAYGREPTTMRLRAKIKASMHGHD
jgi:16S rRNA (adenine(1408)-N(1))-methyltransferase